MTQMAERVPAFSPPVNEALLEADQQFSVIDVVQSPATDVSNLGSVTEETIIFDDGSRYQHLLFLPYKPKPNTPAVTNTTAWCTSIKGFNSNVATMLMGEGIAVDLVAPPNVGVGHLLHLASAVKLDHDVAAHQKILDFDMERGIIDTSRVVLPGDSRGGQVAMGISATAKDYDREVIYFDLTDPCLEHRLSKEEIKPIPLIKYLGSELVNGLFTFVENLTPSEVITSFPVTPNALAQDVAVGYSLFSTGSGRYVNAIPRDAVGRVTFFVGSVLNHREKYKQRFDAMPNVIVDEIEGFHLDIAKRAHTKNSVLRVGRAAWLASEGEDLRTHDLSQPILDK